MISSNRHEQQHQLSHTELRRAQRQATAISSFLISLMMTLVAYGVTEMAHTFEWKVTTWVLVPFIFLATMETLYAKEIEKRINKDFGNSAFFRIAEIVLLAMLLRVALLFGGSPEVQWSAFVQQLSEPIAAWFAPEYTVSLFVLVLVWIFLLISYQDMNLIYNLEEFTDWDQVGKHQANLAKKRTIFLNRFIFLGITVLLAMIFSDGFWEQDGGIRFIFKGHTLPMVLVVMGYFLLLLLLMSQTQLARLRTRWWVNNSVVNFRVQRDWMRISLTFFAVAALVALLSPTGFAESIFTVLQTILLFLMTAVQLIFAIIFVPISILLSWIFPAQAQSEGEAIPQDIPSVVEETAEQITSQPPAWLDTASDIVVWVFLGGVIVFALVQYLRQDRNLGADIIAFFTRIKKFFQDAWLALQGGVGVITANIQRRRRMGQAIHTESDLSTQLSDDEIGLRFGQPRKDIFRLYRQLLTHGRNIGVVRKVSQTPLQYEETLSTETGSTATGPLHQLTEAFDDARYSQHELTQLEADRIAEEWEILRHRLHRKK